MHWGHPLNRISLRGASFDRLRTQIALVAGSTAIGQILVTASAPLIARLFTPADFGVSAGYSFLLMLFLAVNSLRYEFAIPLPKSDAEASNLTALTISLVVGLSILFTALVWGFADQITRLLNEPRLRELLPLLPVGLIIGGVLLALNYWLTRRKQFAPLSLIQLSSNIGQVSAQIIAGVAHMGAFGLALSFMVGQFIACVIALRRTLPLPDVQPRTWLPLAREYKNFPLFTTAASLVDIAGTNLPAVLFLAYFSATEAGYFSLTMRLMTLPASLISNAVAQVIYPRLSEAREDKLALRALFLNIATALLILSLAGFGFVLVAGGQLFSIVLGELWRASGVYAQILAPFFLISFISSPLSTLSLVFERQKVGLAFSVIVTVLRVAALLLSALTNSPEVGVALFSLTSFIIYVVYLVWLLHLADIRLSDWLWSLRGLIALNGLLILAGFMLSNTPFVLLVGIGFAAVALFYVRKVNLS